jgi:PGAP1-like protein
MAALCQRGVSPAPPPELQKETTMREIGHFIGGTKVGGGFGRFADALKRLFRDGLLATLALTGISAGTCLADPTVPVLFIPGYGASHPNAGSVASFAFSRGASPTDLSLSASYDLLVRSLTRAGYVSGKTFFGAVFDYRMLAAPDDGNFDGILSNVTAASITSGNFAYAVNYLGYWLDQAVQANPGVPYVDIVTHSTGGILARAYIQSPAYGGSYVDRNGRPRQLPRIRNLILGANPNEGTVHSWRPWGGDFQDVLSGFIPTGCDPK